MKTMLLLLIALLSLTSCSSDDNVFFDELNANRQLWQSLEIKDYKINERYVCGECTGVFNRDVFVVNGLKDKVEFDESALPEGFTYQHVFDASQTINDAFDFIEKILNQNVASFTVEYDATYGYPKSIGVDYDANAVDDEIGYIYSNLEPLN